jgi:RIO kinase 1
VARRQGAVDTELGVLKTGKEADVRMLERADPHDPDGGVVVAAKRYRPGWAALVRLWKLGLPVPYPVQIDETASPTAGART